MRPQNLAMVRRAALNLPEAGEDSQSKHQEKAAKGSVE